MRPDIVSDTFSVLYTVVGGKVVYQRKGAEAWRSGQLFKAISEFDHVN